jgi:hypothetical protein
LCEANAKSPYWPVNGIQCNFYDDWLEYGRVNDYNVVWAPLNRTLSANFDINAAWEFVDAHLGIDYGWEIVLMGLLDTRHGNEICVDSARTNCIVAEHWEMVGALTEKLADVAARHSDQLIAPPSDRASPARPPGPPPKGLTPINKANFWN